MAKKNTKEKKDYLPSFGFWPTKSGKGFTVAVNDNLLQTLSQATPGSRLLLQEVPEEFIKYDDDGAQKSPSYRVTIFPPDDNAKKIEATDSI